MIMLFGVGAGEARFNVLNALFPPAPCELALPQRGYAL
jgi:hypothetical protein